MKHAVLLGSTFLLALTTLAAQSANGPSSNLGSSSLGPKELVLKRADAATACPIAMRARHEFFFQRKLVSGTDPNLRGPATEKEDRMQIGFTLTNPDDHPITEARVTMYGTNGQWQIVPADAVKKSGNVSKTMNILFEPGDGRDANAHLVVRGFTSITSIVLNSVTYADGSVWKTFDQGACQVAPDGLMLVAGR
jgi:hypothetical protein